MNKKNLKDYNRLLRAENEALKYILQEAEDSLSDGCRCGEIKLLQEENGELVKDLNDLQADWATDHVKTVKAHEADCALTDMTLKEFERINEDLIAQRDRAVRVTRGLRNEKYNMGMELEQLKKDKMNLCGQVKYLQINGVESK